MNVLFDACVLYPTVMREVLLGVAHNGRFVPKWSERILGEWVRAAAKYGAEHQAIAQGEAVLCQSNWPDASVAPATLIEAKLYLPDPNDIHVLAAAIAGQCTTIVTMNLKDFPARELSAYSIHALHPDVFLLDIFRRDPMATFSVVDKVRLRAEQLSGHEWTARALMKKARLPRFGKALQGYEKD